MARGDEEGQGTPGFSNIRDWMEIYHTTAAQKAQDRAQWSVIALSDDPQSPKSLMDMEPMIDWLTDLQNWFIFIPKIKYRLIHSFFYCVN